jgi:uncharacterized protein YbjT (DUF2867 family)
MKKISSVLVVGATGFLGTQICVLLTQQNKKVKALVRSTSDPKKIKVLQDMGIDTVVADVKDPASLKNICAGINAVITTVSSTFSRSEGDSIDTVDRQGQLNLVDAAARSGVEHFVYISFLQSPENFPLQDAKHTVEKKIQESNMTYTILRPTFFMEIWLSPHLGFEPQKGTVKIYGDGVNKISWISIRNVADFAVASLENSFAENKIIDLGGPETLSPLDIVHMFEESEQRSIDTSFIPVEILIAQKESADDPLSQSFAGLMITYAGGAIVPMKETQNTFNIKLISVKECFGLN